MYKSFFDVFISNIEIRQILIGLLNYNVYLAYFVVQSTHITCFGPKITLAEIITSGFFGVFSKTIFHVLQSDSTHYNSPSPKKRRCHSVDTCTLHSQHELNLLHEKFESFYKKSSSPVHNNSNKINTSTLPASVYQCYEKQINSRTKPDFQSLHLHTFQPNERKRSSEMSLSQDSLDKILIIHKPRRNFSLISQALVINTFLF